MKLTVLGCSTPVPRPGNPCSGYLLSTSSTSILLDCGSGTFSGLLEYASPGDLSGIWISHMHPDHCADLVTLANWALNTDDAPRLQVFGPMGWDSRLNGFISEDSSTNLAADAFDVSYIEDGATIELGGLSLTSRLVRHSVPGYGVRVSEDEVTFAYSGDTGLCGSLDELAKGADVFLCEAGSETPTEHHLTIQQACDVALRAAVGKLLVTHVPYTLPVGWQSVEGAILGEAVYARGEWSIGG